MWPFVTRAPEAPSGGKEEAKKTSNLQSKCSCNSTEALEHSTAKGDTEENEMKTQWKQSCSYTVLEVIKYYCGAAMKMYEIQMDSCLFYIDIDIQEELGLFQGLA